MSCVGTDMPRNRTAADPTPFAWTDLTWLLHRYHVSWGYYLDHGAQTPADPAGVPTIWNVLPGFTDVTQDDQMNDVQPLTSFMAQARVGTLPQLSWIVPDPKDSEHPPALISTGPASRGLLRWLRGGAWGHRVRPSWAGLGLETRTHPSERTWMCHGGLP
jgi:phospholipase C